MCFFLAPAAGAAAAGSAASSAAATSAATMTAISAAIMAASAAASTAAAYQGQQSQNKASEYNATIMNRNAEIARMQGEEAVKAGEKEEMDYRKGIRKLIGAQKAGYAAAGVDVNEGTPVEVLAQTEQQGEVDALTIRRNAQLRQWGYENESNNYIANANLLKLQKKSPLLAGGSTLLGSLSPLAGKYLEYKYMKS